MRIISYIVYHAIVEVLRTQCSAMLPHLLYYRICAAEACKCTSELPVRRAVSKLTAVVLYCIGQLILSKFNYISKLILALNTQTNN